MHLQIEAYRRVREDRDQWMGDPRFVHLEDALAGRLSSDFARSCCSGLDPKRAAGLHGSGKASDIRDTTYLCVADPYGNIISWIQSIFHPFGSGWIVPGTGILLNNRMTGFSLEPGSPNRLEPGHRPIHTLNTWIVLREGEPWLIGGTPGGEAQVQINSQILRARLARGSSLAEAIHAPRWRIDERGRVAVEGRLPREARRRLERAGHEVVRLGPWEGTGLVQAIERLPEGGWLACTDPRGEGMAAGY
jgi:gamma-glutamyltranspeptidase/glutathione hydrolase